MKTKLLLSAIFTLASILLVVCVMSAKGNATPAKNMNHVPKGAYDRYKPDNNGATGKEICRVLAYDMPE